MDQTHQTANEWVSITGRAGESPLKIFQNGLGSRMDVQLVVHPANMESDTIQADTELVADFFITIAQGQLLQNLTFARCQILHNRRLRPAHHHWNQIS